MKWDTSETWELKLSHVLLPPHYSFLSVLLLGVLYCLYQRDSDSQDSHNPTFHQEYMVPQAFEKRAWLQEYTVPIAKTFSQMLEC